MKTELIYDFMQHTDTTNTMSPLITDDVLEACLFDMTQRKSLATPSPDTGACVAGVYLGSTRDNGYAVVADKRTDKLIVRNISVWNNAYNTVQDTVWSVGSFLVEENSGIEKVYVLGGVNCSTEDDLSLACAPVEVVISNLQSGLFLGRGLREAMQKQMFLLPREFPALNELKDVFFTSDHGVERVAVRPTNPYPGFFWACALTVFAGFGSGENNDFEPAGPARYDRSGRSSYRTGKYTYKVVNVPMFNHCPSV